MARARSAAAADGSVLYENVAMLVTSWDVVNPLSMCRFSMYSESTATVFTAAERTP